MTNSLPRLAEPRGKEVAPTNRVDNPFAGDIARQPNGGGALVAVEQQRAIAEVQARMLIARANPRDQVRAVDQILNDCTRPTLAEQAVYTYARGGTDIRGPTIRLAEAIAQRWGNIASGIKELARHDGYSECVAYAWDLETGFYDERQFQIRHWRDTKKGGYQLSDERDIYELIANFGQRRKRAVLLTVIPGDVIEAALEQCETTMESRADITPEGIKKLVEAFATLGVEPAAIEKRIQRRLDSIRPAQVVALRKIYNSIKDSMSEPADWFDEQPASEVRPQTPPVQEQPPPRRRGRPPGATNRQRQDERDDGFDPAPDGPTDEPDHLTPAEPPPEAEPERPAPRRGVSFEE